MQLVFADSSASPPFPSFFPPTQPFASCELSTQTYQDPIAQHNDQFSLGTQTQQDFTQSSLGTQTQRNHDQFSLGTQTQQNHAQFSLGTQTQQNHAQFSLGTQTREDHAQFTLGTQTQCDLTQFSLGTQTQQDLTQFSLCDFGTQTMDGLNLVEQVLGTSLLPPECMDFGTQTRGIHVTDHKPVTEYHGVHLSCYRLSP